MIGPVHDPPLGSDSRAAQTQSQLRGMDVAGRVEAVVKQVTRFQPRDDVFGWCDGSCAEYAAAGEDHFRAQTDHPHIRAGGSGSDLRLGASRGLREEGQIQWKSLIIGAAGGVWSFLCSGLSIGYLGRMSAVPAVGAA
jgi:NADPH:quinone reductase-like Zn-dependent oxidoreductase